MQCIYCGGNYNRVLNSRDTKRGTQIWRRRKCLNCKEIFTTYEMIDLSHLTVTKKSGRTERFVPMKIYAGLFQACLYSKHADKGEMALHAKELTDKILIEVAKLTRKNMLTTEIRNLILDVLYKKSPETFLRYLAYVKSPKTSDALRKELSKFFK